MVCQAVIIGLVGIIMLMACVILSCILQCRYSFLASEQDRRMFLDFSLKVNEHSQHLSIVLELLVG